MQHATITQDLLWQRICASSAPEKSLSKGCLNMSHVEWALLCRLYTFSSSHTLSLLKLGSNMKEPMQQPPP